MLTLLVILQNEYGLGEEPLPRHVWLRRLWHSYTGKRLSEMLPEGCQVEVINASQLMGKGPAACFPPDPEYIARMVSTYRPDVILACGRVAQAGARALGLQYISAPHPAWRRLSKERTQEIRRSVAERLVATLRKEGNSMNLDLSAQIDCDIACALRGPDILDGQTALTWLKFLYTERIRFWCGVHVGVMARFDASHLHDPGVGFCLPVREQREGLRKLLAEIRYVLGPGRCPRHWLGHNVLALRHLKRLERADEAEADALIELAQHIMAKKSDCEMLAVAIWDTYVEGKGINRTPQTAEV